MTEYVVLRMTRSGQRVVAVCELPESAYTIRAMCQAHLGGTYVIQERISEGNDGFIQQDRQSMP